MIVCTVILWPWVARAPGNLFTAIRLFSHFPWEGQVLFGGRLYPSDALPASYLPQFLGLQLPEIALLGVVAAAGFGVRGAFVRGRDLLTDRLCLCYAVVAAAVLIPVLHFVVDRPIVYNGIRHYLFVVPPLLVLAGIGLERAFAWGRGRGRWPAGVFAAAFGAAAVAQIAIMARLHPYEYIYYNAFAGGTAGAAGRYDLDYWGLSLSEATRNLERVLGRDKAAPHARPIGVYVCGDRLSATYYFPPGSRLYYSKDASRADYAVGIRDAECASEIHGRVMLEVERDNVDLSYAADMHPARG